MASAILIGGGRMGALLKASLEEAGFSVLGVYDINNADELAEAAPAADVAVDFSHKDSLALVLTYIKRTGAALVSGTTGYTADELEQLKSLGQKSAVIHSGNYSLGIAALRHATELVVQELEGWDVEIVETHHNKKADAPSGTAKMLLEAVDAGQSSSVIYGREGMIGERPQGEIAVHALRGGTVAGIHEVHLFGLDEEVTLTHRATSRQIFVTGAVAAAKRLLQKEPGFYTFDELMFG